MKFSSVHVHACVRPEMCCAHIFELTFFCARAVVFVDWSDLTRCQDLNKAEFDPSTCFLMPVALLQMCLCLSDIPLRPDDGRVHVRVFLEKSIYCYINGHPKQYIYIYIYPSGHNN